MLDHHCIWTNNCVGRGSFKWFVVYNVLVIIQTLAGIFVVLRNKLFYSKKYDLDKFQINIVHTFLGYTIMPCYYQVLYFKDLILQKLESLKIEPSTVDKAVLDPLAYLQSYNSDDLMFLVMVFFTCFSLMLTVMFLEGVRTDTLYVDKLQMQRNKVGRHSNVNRRNRTMAEVFEFVFRDLSSVEEISRRFLQQNSKKEM